MAVTYQSTQTNSGTNTTVITKPVSLAVGDAMLGAIWAGTTNGNGTATAPAGWTQKQSVGFFWGTQYLFWKVADAADAAATNFTFTGGGTGTRLIWGSVTRVTGGAATTPIDQASQAAQSGGVSGFSTGTITPTAANSLCFIFTCGGDSTAYRTVSGYAYVTNNPTWTEAYDLNMPTDLGDFIEISMAYASRAQTTATGNATATASAANSDFLVSMTVDIIPPAGGGTGGLLSLMGVGT